MIPAATLAAFIQLMSASLGPCDMLFEPRITVYHATHPNQDDPMLYTLYVTEQFTIRDALRLNTGERVYTFSDSTGYILREYPIIENLEHTDYIYPPQQRPITCDLPVFDPNLDA